MAATNIAVHDRALEWELPWLCITSKRHITLSHLIWSQMECDNDRITRSFGVNTLDLPGNCLDIEDIDCPIYRAFSLTRALDLFTNNKNALVHPSLWEDPLENLFLKARVFNGSEEVNVENLQARWYGQCWTMQSESDAMWRIYSPSKDSVRIKTTPHKLIKSMAGAGDPQANLKFFIGKVSYKKTEEIKNDLINTAFSDLTLGGQNASFAKTLLIKRTEFKHEREVRALFYDVNGTWAGKTMALFEFDADALVDHVMLDPRLDRRVADGIHFAFQSAGCNCPIDRSELYQAPQLAINF